MHPPPAACSDLKPANILLEWGEGAYPLLRLCDLGSARRLGAGTAPATPFVTSRFYRAPELLCGSDSYGPPVDTWALACTIAELYLTVASFTEPDAAAVISHRRGDGGSFDARQRAQRVQHAAAPRMRAREAAHACAVVAAATRARAGEQPPTASVGGCWLGTARKTLQFDAVAADDEGDGSGEGTRGARHRGGLHADGCDEEGEQWEGEDGEAVGAEEGAFDGGQEVRAARDRHAQCVTRAQAMATATASPRAGSDARAYARLYRVRASLQDDVEAAQADWDHARDLALPGGASRYRWAPAASAASTAAPSMRGSSGGGASGASSCSGVADAPPPAPLAGAGLPPPPPRLSVANTNLFNGATCDGEQLAQIINLLGTPTPAEVAGMRLGPAHGALLRGIVATVAASAAATVDARSENGAVAAAAATAVATRDGASAGAGGGGARVPRQGSAPYDAASSSSSAASAASTASGHSSSSSGFGTGAGSSACVPPQQRALPAKDVAGFLARRSVPRDVAAMLAAMLAWDPAARLAPSDALRHPALLAFPAITPASRLRAAAVAAPAAGAAVGESM